MRLKIGTKFRLGFLCEIKGNDARGEGSIIRKRCDIFSDTDNPKVTMCPTSFEVRLSPGERNRLIFWQEPTFTDNVGVEHVYKTRVRERVFKFYIIIHLRICSIFRNSQIFYLPVPSPSILKLIKSLPSTMERINIENKDTVH